MLVSHDQHLIEACATEVWLCKEGTVKRLNGGLKEYRDEHNLMGRIMTQTQVCVLQVLIKLCNHVNEFIFAADHHL